MYELSKSSPICNFDGEAFKVFLDWESNKIYLSDNVPCEFVLLMGKTMLKEYDMVYFKLIEECPACGSKLIKNGTGRLLLNKNMEIRKQKYVCSDKKCNKHVITDLNKFKDKYCNYTRDLMEFSLNLGLIDYSSYEKKSEIIELVTGVKIPRSTAYYHERTLTDEYLAKKEKEISNMLKKLNIEPEGVYHYDEQVLWVNTQMKFRMTILDATNNLIIKDKVIDQEDFNKNTIGNFLNKALEDLELKAIITDGHQAYPSIIEALGAIHQKCIFHKMQILMKKVLKTTNKLKIKIKNHSEKIKKNKLKITQLKIKNHGPPGRISKKDKKRQKYTNKIKKLEKENKTLRTTIRKNKAKIEEFEKYTDKISSIFKSDNIKLAMKRFNRLKNKINYLPEEIATFIKNLSKDITNTLNHIINDKIPNTNNKLEGFYKITLPRYLKKTFRTDKGLDTKLRLNRIRWTTRNVLNKQNFIS